VGGRPNPAAKMAGKDGGKGEEGKR